MWAHVLLWSLGNHPASAWSAGVGSTQTPQLSLLAVFPHSLSRYYPLPYHPAVLRLLCAYETSSAQWAICVLPCTVDTMQGRGKEQSMCRWRPRTGASSLAARISSRLCRRNSTGTVTLLVVHAADAYEEGCDGSFHARHHTRLLRCVRVPSAPPHDA